MGHRPCCRSCRHCLPPQGTQLGWCQLRQLPIHTELVAELWCHHWTARPPRLPVMGPATSPAMAPPGNEQLSLASMLQGS
jgi:hypothetical protein